ncbi:nucleotidyltransferase family protein [Pseudokineococcus sp. 1T1Z-3]|uniref:nucleotidyltransferase family protein n=1 Tax=Pseudokineococcus sp. 1T1Z-3 TaxID=3132745 RepID=UPI0030A7DA2B
MLDGGLDGGLDGALDGGRGAVVGLVLAAGAGRRAGGPKGLRRDGDGEPWVAARVRALGQGGCARVLVVVGAAGEDVAALVPAGAQVVRAPGWARGLSASLSAGLAAASDLERGGAAALAGGAVVGRWSAAAVVPVDVPDLGAAEVARVLGAWPGVGLARAVHDGRPGHPVVLDRASWGQAAAGTGDEGARRLLVGADVLRVECGDLASGLDVDGAPSTSPTARRGG